MVIVCQSIQLSMSSSPTKQPKLLHLGGGDQQHHQGPCASHSFITGYGFSDMRHGLPDRCPSRHTMAKQPKLLHRGGAVIVFTQSTGYSAVTGAAGTHSWPGASSSTRAVPQHRRLSRTHCLRGRSATGGSTVNRWT